MKLTDTPEFGPNLPPESGRLDAGVHALPLRVYYEDTDVGGIVYYANYLKFMERGRSDMLRLAGVDQASMMQPGDSADEALMFAVRHCSVDYLKPARYDDEILVRTWLHEITGASVTMVQEISRKQEILVRASVKAAVLNKEGAPRRLPRNVRHILDSLISSNAATASGPKALKALTQQASSAE